MLDKSVITTKLAALYQEIVAIREDDAYLKSIGAYGSDMSIELWDWSQGVGLYGIWRLYEATGDQTYVDYLSAWFERHRAEAAVKNVNHVAPMLTLVSLLEQQENVQWRALVNEYGEWIEQGLLRTEMGGFAHTTATRNNEGQLWVDTLFMSGLFHVKAGQLLNKPAYCEEVIYQFLLHTQFLSDPVSGLWRHGWHFTEKHHFAGALWGRGNGWAAITAVELLELTRASHSASSRFIEQNFLRQSEALLNAQADNGMWHTLLNDPHSYQESSATAAIAYAFLKGYRLGILDSRFADAGVNAIAALLARIDQQGQLAEVSSGTPVFMTLPEYTDVPIRQRSYGQSLAMLALAEMLRHPDLMHTKPV
ncbi:glycoside hydrolase family 105 protein [Candidatus Symbiopectobacterium sp. NZEC151]|uniref:glycoside hydrolase family 88/105 protein n=1 Tax=Candidatus Symbiopectobacterium sp. NZEC151 TaxID=2820470 RepID=UPI002226D0BA|nr:glycoside hydrolase family 88 protein [Candidatus Symbiopectobacterium sp. NZEC151]MCW2475997.1 glycoside hydrolase family 88 protein [Candidatus Symbiopectobacterium sp. NZEC151]